MKPKYYPIITISAAAAMVLLPLCFVLALPYLRVDGFESSDDFVAEDLSAPVLGDRMTLAVHNAGGAGEIPAAREPLGDDTHRPAKTNSVPDESPARPSMAATLPVVGLRPSESQVAERRDESMTSTRVAMRPADRSQAIADFPSTVSSHGNSERTNPPTILDTDAVLDMAAIDELVVDVPAMSSDSNVPPPVVPDRVVNEVAIHGAMQADGIDFVAADPSKATFEPPHVTAPSYFDATGHLAMAGGSSGGMAGMTPPQRTAAKIPDERSVKDTKGRPTRRESSRSRSAAARKHSSTQAADTPIQGFDSPWVLPGDGFGTQKQVPIVDVILQQPLEARPVQRMENVVAVSREKGWPIALVKSDLPDDHWWVQQMVGVRGNAFAARVNFGNEYSISGSVYQLVFVFLDSPDEVRRFRIAKQFEEVPEGVRRSREFTFIRK